MEVLVKRENWDEGMWMELPATEEASRQVYEQLRQMHPSIMVPFIGDVAEMKLIMGLAKCLRGESVFSEGHLEQLNSLAEKINGWGDGERLLFNAALEMEQPDTIEKVMGVIDHLDEFEWRNDITNMYQLGLYKMKEMNLHLPLELEKYFDYEHFGRLNQTSNEVMTDYGLAQRKKTEPDLRQKENPDAVRYGRMIFEVCVPSNTRRYEKHRFRLPMKESELEGEGKRLGLDHLAERTDYYVSSKLSYLDAYLPPLSSIGELNQVAWEIWKIADRMEVSQRKLLAILEAEASRTIDETCRVIREYADYEILPDNIIKPDDYAHYLLNLHHVQIPKELEPCVRFREYGFPILLDDFGSGFSSLNVLKDISFDIIKLDRSFLGRSEFTYANKSIINSIVNLSRDLNVEVLCEGVENEAQARFLKGIGCKMAQGFFYAKPMAVEDFEMLYDKIGSKGK